MATIKTNLPCIKCDSSDAMAIYEDGFGHCFSCKTHFFPDEIENGSPTRGAEKPSKASNFDPTYPTSEPANVPSRGLQKATLAYYGVGVEFNEESGEPEQLVFPVWRNGEKTGEKKKNLTTKQFTAIGACKDPDFFGADKVGEGGKLLIVTEGEEDAMSAHQMLRQQGKNYHVVSLPNGASSSAVRKRLTWLESFETIVLNLDNDEVGIKAAKEIGDILSPGKTKILHLPTKDANEYLLNVNNSKAYLQLIWNAKTYRPDGIINLADSWDLMWSTWAKDSIPYPWSGLNRKLYGLREREIVTITAGSGVGKSAGVRELEHWLLNNTQDNIGVLALEESVGRTSWGIVSVEANLPLSIKEEHRGVSEEDVKVWFDKTLGTGRYFTLDHFGATSESNLISMVRYLIKGLQCQWIVLDHLSIVVAAMDDIGDERKAIDSIMTRLRQLVEETNAGMILVCHLRRVDGNKGHEQGIEVSLSHLRGSQSIAQLSDSVIAFERNQQADDEKQANLTRVRVLKNRYAGLTGIATYLAYDRETGRLREIEDVQGYLMPDLNF